MAQSFIMHSMLSDRIQQQRRGRGKTCFAAAPYLHESDHSFSVWNSVRRYWLGTSPVCFLKTFVK